MNYKDILPLIKDTFHEWSEDKAPRLGAALAYYSAFSVAPLVLLVLGVAGLIFGAEAAQGQVVEEISGTVGQPVAKAVEGMLSNAHQTGTGVMATVIGLVTLLFGASGVFGQLQDALNTIWKVAPKPGRGLKGIIQDRFLSLTMVLGTGFLLLVSLVITATLATVSQLWTPSSLPGGAWLWQGLNGAVAFAIVTVLFAMIFKLLPDAEIAWRDVWIGAVLTTVLFTVGKFLLGLYLGREGTTSSFGAAGSLVLILLWVYYSAQILLFGAEFTRVYASRYGSGLKPAANAVPLTKEELAKQGMPRTEDLERAVRTQPKGPQNKTVSETSSPS